MKAKPSGRAPPKTRNLKAEKSHFVLLLYIAGQSPKSVAAITNARKICNENLPGGYVLDVIDLYQQPHLAQEEQIIALPALIRKQPPPTRRVIGDMSNADRVINGLNLRQGA